MKLDTIRALIEAATPGPWKHEFGAGTTGNNHNVTFGDGLNQFVARYVAGRGNGGAKEEWANAEFIAASRTLLPKLLAVALEAESFTQAHEAGDCESSGIAAMRKALTALESE